MLKDKIRAYTAVAGEIALLAVLAVSAMAVAGVYGPMAHRHAFSDRPTLEFWPR
jgi:hypothetical protein